MTDHIDALQAVRAIDLLTRKGPPPTAMCPTCRDEPLVFTFERPYHEFTCLKCGGWFGFLDPIPAEATPELDALVEERKAEYAKQREARR